jgi:hypothetical protein
VIDSGVQRSSATTRDNASATLFHLRAARLPAPAQSSGTTQRLKVSPL